MFQIKPTLETTAWPCPACQTPLTCEDLLWQGIHICEKSVCPDCGGAWVRDLPLGHARTYPSVVDIDHFKFAVAGGKIPWFHEPLRRSLEHPFDDGVDFTIETRIQEKEVVILNCLDFIFGHSLLKLLNCSRYLLNSQGPGLVVLIPATLHWMVPAGVSEIWTVGLSWKDQLGYHRDLEKKIKARLADFDKVWLSPAYAIPRDYDISQYTGVPRFVHLDDSMPRQVCFVWRENRPWSNPERRWFSRLPGGIRRALRNQRRNIIRLFSGLRTVSPEVRFVVAGIGTSLTFPSWIEDRRIAAPSQENEKSQCEIFSRSGLVIGVHGSHMLLPSGHAGASLHLLPADKVSNTTQDILCHESDPLMALFHHRHASIQAPLPYLKETVHHMLFGHEPFSEHALAPLHP